MDAKEFYDKVKETFPEAVAISVNCGAQDCDHRDGGLLLTWSGHAYPLPIGQESIALAYGIGYTPEEALREMVAYKAKKPSWVRLPPPLDMAQLAGNILGVNKAA